MKVQANGLSIARQRRPAGAAGLRRGPARRIPGARLVAIPGMAMTFRRAWSSTFSNPCCRICG
jgi:hypothetical protein